MSLINREALYEKVCGLEAQALSYIEKIIHDEDKVEEWKIWSAILTERTAFKHDIFDAPEIKPERPKSKWVDSWRSKMDGTRYWYRECDHCGYERKDCDPEKDSNFCPNCGFEMI